MTLVLLERSADYALQNLARVTAADLDVPTPCPGWDLRMLLEHLASSAEGLAGVGTPPPASVDPATVAEARIRHLVDVVRAGTGPDGAAQGGAIELAAHGWDIAEACGLDHGIPHEHAGELLRLVESLVDDDARRAFFGPAVDLPAAATPSDRFVAFLGRDPGSSQRS